MNFIVIAALLAAITYLYFYLKHKYSYWSRLGIAGPWPIPFIGNLHKQVNAHSIEIALSRMRTYGHLIGIYAGLTPALVISDPGLVKRILVKDFAHFHDRISLKCQHRLWNCNLFFSNDEDWKRLRVITSPSFSSGKLRGMAQIMGTSIKQLDEHFASLSENAKGAGIMETKKTTAGFTIDIISATVFATETNANKDADNLLVKNGRQIMDVNPLRLISAILLPTRLLQCLGIETFFDPKPFNFFINLTSHIVALRKKDGATVATSSKRANDLVQLMIDARAEESELKKVNYERMSINEEIPTIDEETTNLQVKETSIRGKLTDDEIIANCIFFFIAGYETTASALAHTFFELARNLDIQERLRRELCEALEQFDSPDSSGYVDTVMNRLPYLEAVIKETLRRYPPVINLLRECATDGYQLTPEIRLRKGTAIFIPTPAIHLCPEHFPNPLTFNPERFMPENKDLLVPYTFLPFSVGPRNCIAMRFAYQELKLCLASILRKYAFATTPETPAQLSFDTSNGLSTAKPFQLKVIRRV